MVATTELDLRFPDATHLLVDFGDQTVGPFDFDPGITARDLADVRWYLEVYGGHYTTEVDDARAHRIEASFARWGNALFVACFGSRAARLLFDRLIAADDVRRALTVNAGHSAILWVANS